MENRQLQASQHFTIDQLQLGERVESPDAVRLPLRLAVALLKDRNGVIDVDLPITGSLDDPQFRLGPIIWKAVVGLLTKVATAPFALLGKLFGGGEEMNVVDFEPGEAMLDPTGQERMAALVKALNERPQLELEVPTGYSPEVDSPVLARRKLENKLLWVAQQQAAARMRGNIDIDPASLAFEAADSEVADALNRKDPVTERDLEELAQSRAHAIQDALLSSGEVDPARVFILGASQTAPKDNKVRLELSLK